MLNVLRAERKLSLKLNILLSMHKRYNFAILETKMASDMTLSLS